VERRFVKEVTAAIKALADNPTPMNMQVSEEDPSIYWIAVPGDYIVFYEIVDEEQFIRILDIE